MPIAYVHINRSELKIKKKGNDRSPLRFRIQRSSGFKKLIIFEL